MQPSPVEVTQLLNAWRKGDASALERLAPVVEYESRRVARAYMRREKPGHTLQPTALINEAYLRLFEWNQIDWEDRAHFLSVAAKMMRRILVNHALSRGSQKRLGSAILVPIEDAAGRPQRTHDLIALDEALAALAEMDPRKGQLVELRFFGGLTAEESVAVLGVSLRTVHREWELARAWLFRALRGV